MLNYPVTRRRRGLAGDIGDTARRHQWSLAVLLTVMIANAVVIFTLYDDYETQIEVLNLKIAKLALENGAGAGTGTGAGAGAGPSGSSRILELEVSVSSYKTSLDNVKAEHARARQQINELKQQLAASATSASTSTSTSASASASKQQHHTVASEADIVQSEPYRLLQKQYLKLEQQLALNRPHTTTLSLPKSDKTVLPPVTPPSTPGPSPTTPTSKPSTQPVEASQTKQTPTTSVVSQPHAAPAAAPPAPAPIDTTIRVPEADADPHGVPAEVAAHYANAVTPAQKRDAVKEEFKWAWEGYKTYAWGLDELHPLSKRGDGGFSMGLTIVDSLDTMLLMDLRDEYIECRNWIQSSLQFKTQHGINLFETTIRILGGLLSAYGLTGDEILKTKATELGDAMLFAFDSPSGYPYGTLDLDKRKAYNPSWAGGGSSISEVGTVQLEFAYLSKITGNPVYESTTDKPIEKLHSHPNNVDGLFHMFINPDTGTIQGSTLTFGARVDSLYEYFLKQWVQSKGEKRMAKDLYDRAMVGMQKHLIAHTKPTGLTYIAEKNGAHGEQIGKMDHLVCWVPGMLALGTLDSVGGEYGRPSEETKQQHMKLAEELAHTCYEFYRRSPTGLAPEIIRFNDHNDFHVDPGAKHNLLRPETVESLFIMWRITHDQKYRDWGWEIFQSFVHYTRIPSGGYSNLHDVTNNRFVPGDARWANWSDKMESFFLAETLKYLYLLFSDDDVVPLDKYVFNTEAHPLPIDPANTKPFITV
jgi:endoplasmic reticulum Man9GlcNAc2 1,2-alpha-mannosidase